MDKKLIDQKIGALMREIDRIKTSAVPLDVHMIQLQSC